MSPFRFAGQWALLPVIAGAAVVTGGLLGLLDGWATTERVTVEPWMLEVLRSSLPVIIATAMIGMATNSWTIATMTGALALVTAEVATDAARWYWFDVYPPLSDEIVQLPLALLAGGALGLSGCVWQHESGYTRSLGAAVLAGALGWLSWRELAPDNWPLDMVHLTGWLAGALVILIVGRCRGLGQMVIALIGAVIVAFGIDLIDVGSALDVRSTITTLLEQWNQLVDRLRSGG